MQVIGILGASKYSEAVLQDRKVDVVVTPFGDLPVELGEINGIQVVWIRRFGWADKRPSHIVNHRVHMSALRVLGVKRAFTLNGFGGINPEMQAGDLAVPHDYIKFLHREPPTIFTEEVGWVRVDLGAAVGGPYCGEIRQTLIEVARQTSNRRVWGQAVNLCVQGPHLETEAEINAARILGADIISTTIWPELVYARELGICFASFCWISDMAGQLSATEWKMLPIQELAEIIKLAVKSIPEGTRCQCQKHWQEEVDRQRLGYWRKRSKEE